MLEVDAVATAPRTSSQQAVKYLNKMENTIANIVKMVPYVAIYIQCDQMARLVFQYWAIYICEHLPDGLIFLPKRVGPKFCQN